jgi:hypothetical protein
MEKRAVGTIVIAAVTMLACEPPRYDQKPHEIAAYWAVVDAWNAAGMPDVSSDCDIESFVVRENSNSCGPGAYGCMRLIRHGGPVRGVKIPYIYIAGWHRSESYLMVHELLHAFSDCSGVGGSVNHSNSLVWSASETENRQSVQTVAVDLLRVRGEYLE